MTVRRWLLLIVSVSFIFPFSANAQSEIKGCVKQSSHFNIVGLVPPLDFIPPGWVPTGQLSKICKWIAVGQNNYPVVVRSEFIFQGGADVGRVFNATPVPTDYEVKVRLTNYPIISKVGALNCMNIITRRYYISNPVPRTVQSWSYATPKKACPQ
jgi:hypothetical protein